MNNDQPKLIIHNADGTKTEVVPNKMWQPSRYKPLKVIQPK